RMPANRTASLVGREALGGPYVLLTFLHPEAAREARPGQFVMIKAGASAEPPLRRPFSILEASPERETFTLFVKAIGPGSRALARAGRGRGAVPRPARRAVGAPRRRRRGAHGRGRLRSGALRVPRAGAAADEDARAPLLRRPHERRSAAPRAAARAGARRGAG